MKTVKTADLEGAALDWAVADVDGEGPYFGPYAYGPFATKREYIGCPEGSPYSPSTDWAQGGPLVEDEKIGIFSRGGGWVAEVGGEPNYGADFDCGIVGPTPLIAAMRALVASKLGDTVAVPAELAP